MATVKQSRHMSTDLTELLEKASKFMEEKQEPAPSQGFVDVNKMTKKELKDFGRKGGLGACVAKLDMLAAEEEELMFLSGVVGQFSAADVHFVELDPQVLADLDLPVDQADWLDEPEPLDDDSTPFDEPNHYDSRHASLTRGSSATPRSSSDSFRSAPRFSSEGYDEFAESTGNITGAAHGRTGIRNSVTSVRSSVYSTMSSGSGSQRPGSSLQRTGSGSRGKSNAVGHRARDSTDNKPITTINKPQSARYSLPSPPLDRQQIDTDPRPRSASPDALASEPSSKTKQPKRKLKPRSAGSSALKAGNASSSSVSGGETFFDTSSFNDDYSDRDSDGTAAHSIAGSLASSQHSSEPRWSSISSGIGTGKPLPAGPLQSGLSVEEDGEDEDDENSFSVRDEDEEDHEAGVRYSLSKEPPKKSRSGKSANELVDEWGFVYDKDNEDQILAPERKDIKAYREREAKWLSIVSKMDVGAVKKDAKLKKLVRAGIPASVRGKAWQFLAGSAEFRKNGVYEELLKREPLPIFDAIERDIHRCYPDHVMFREESSQGQIDLSNVLKAYAHYNPSVGYCQGMGRLVGCMLMQMPAEDSFWLLVATVEKYMGGYFIPSLSQLRIDGVVFDQLLRDHEPKLAQHMMDNGVSPLMYIPQWFLTAFTQTLPWPTVLRVWDVFYFEGVKVFYRIGLAIIWVNRDHLLRHCPTNAELLGFLLHIPLDNLGPENLLDTAFKIKLSKEDIKKYSHKADSSTAGLSVELGLNNLSVGQLSNHSASGLVGALGGKLKRINSATSGGSAGEGAGKTGKGVGSSF
ncbi:rab-GTPase-TBC domain-containing protein [Endogone sp. FLAS-F59071]|nr:rab-GTPase-TBC domain-containing protein [Endogone sp. FLAS-F59071]|eukprot:RUS15653.1 rab-GTPase-TBC domain-containing protein [Endogone sp. FLAS-F59071]